MLTEARVVIEDFRRNYNTFRPHSKLGYRSPAVLCSLTLSISHFGWPAAFLRRSSTNHNPYIYLNSSTRLTLRVARKRESCDNVFLLLASLRIAFIDLNLSAKGLILIQRQLIQDSPVFQPDRKSCGSDPTIFQFLGQEGSLSGLGCGLKAGCVLGPPPSPRP